MHVYRLIEENYFSAFFVLVLPYLHRVKEQTAKSQNVPARNTSYTGLPQKVSHNQIIKNLC